MVSLMKKIKLKTINRNVEENLMEELNSSRRYHSDVEILLSSILKTQEIFESYNALVFRKLNISDVEFNILMIINDHIKESPHIVLTKQKIVESLSVKRAKGYKVIESLSIDSRNSEKKWLVFNNVEGDARAQQVNLTLVGQEKYQEVFRSFYEENMIDVLLAINETDSKEIESCLSVLKTLRNAINRSTSRFKENTVPMQEKSLVEFYGIVYSEKLKIMALTGKRTFIDFSEKQLTHDYLSWNQANGTNLLFKNLRDAEDRDSIIMINKNEIEVANVVISFIKKGFQTPSNLKPFIKRLL